jgi:hypothetical protein
MKPAIGETKMKSTVLPMPEATRPPKPTFATPGAHEPADERVRGRRGQAEIPCDGVPRDGAHERAEDHVVVDDLRVDDALADRGGHLQVEDEDRDEVEERGEGDRVVRLQHAGGDDRGDGIRRVVQPVHEVEQQGEGDEEDQHPHPDLEPGHEFSSEMPSARFATSSQRSVMASSSS